MHISYAAQVSLDNYCRNNGFFIIVIHIKLKPQPCSYELVCHLPVPFSPNHFQSSLSIKIKKSHKNSFSVAFVIQSNVRI